jgi:hypothetical protein
MGGEVVERFKHRLDRKVLFRGGLVGGPSLDLHRSRQVASSESPPLDPRLASWLRVGTTKDGSA